MGVKREKAGRMSGNRMDEESSLLSDDDSSSYLKNRKLFVQIGHFSSEQTGITCGVS